MYIFTITYCILGLQCAQIGSHAHKANNKTTWFFFCFIPCWPLPLPLFPLVETLGESYSSYLGTYPLRWQLWPLSWSRIDLPLVGCSSRPSLACISEGHRKSC